MNQAVQRKLVGRGKVLALAALLVALGGSVFPASAQTNTRLLLSSGTEVPGHGGLAFGPFLSLTMNGNQEIIFLTSLRSPRVEMRAVARSSGVSCCQEGKQGGHYGGLPIVQGIVANP